MVPPWSNRACRPFFRFLVAVMRNLRTLWHRAMGLPARAQRKPTRPPRLAWGAFAEPRLSALANKPRASAVQAFSIAWLAGDQGTRIRACGLAANRSEKPRRLWPDQHSELGARYSPTTPRSTVGISRLSRGKRSPKAASCPGSAGAGHPMAVHHRRRTVLSLVCCVPVWPRGAT